MAAENGTLTLVDASSGATSSVDIYISDSAAAAITLAKQGSAGSGSPTFVTYGRDMILVDAAIHTGTATAVGLNFTLDDVRTSTAIRFTSYLDTLNYRPRMGLVVPRGVRLGALQF